MYIVGEHGQRYTIEVQNHTGNRVEAVATVDGLDVIDGRSGSFDKRGYLVLPYATLAIDGFRRSSETVAAFRFGSVAESYADRKGQGRNVGVIGDNEASEPVEPDPERDLGEKLAASHRPELQPRFIRGTSSRRTAAR